MLLVSRTIARPRQRADDSRGFKSISSELAPLSTSPPACDFPEKQFLGTHIWAEGWKGRII